MTSSKQKDLQTLVDSIEAKLTPKELAINYVDEVRRYPTLRDFFKAQAKLTFQKSELEKARKALSQQAHDRYPGSTPQEISARNNLRQTLFTQFHALITLISNVNRIIERKGEVFGMSRLLIQSQMQHLLHLAWQDPFLITASAAAEWIKRNKSNACDRKHKREILQGLAAYTKVMREVPTLLVKSWFSKIEMLIIPLYAFEMAVQNVQEKYFDCHPILSHELEDEWKDTIESFLETRRVYGEYIKDRGDLIGCTSDPRNPSSDGASIPHEPNGEPDLTSIEAMQKVAREMADKIVEDWVTDAHDRGVADSSPATPEHQDVVWRNFQKKFGTKN